MSRSRSGIVAALDVGTTKVCCLIARTRPGEDAEVIGLGLHAARGLRAGTVVDMEAAERAISAAVQAAEEQAGETVSRVTLNLSAGKPTSRRLQIDLPLGGRTIGDDDMTRITRLARAEQGSGGFEVVHAAPVDFRLDGARGIRDPRGMAGDRLETTVLVIGAAATPVRNLVGCVERCHLDVEALVVSPHASGLACLTEDELDLGATVVDMGGGATAVAVFGQRQLLHAECVPVGGAHITNDIAVGLSTPLAHAERLKTLFGGAVPRSSDERQLLDVPVVGEADGGGANHVPRAMLVRIIQPRVEEILEFVKGAMEESGADRLGGRRLVLTGGGSQLEGTRELAAQILDKQVRVARPRPLPGLPQAEGDPALATAVGLLRHALLRPSKRDERAPERAPLLLGRLGRFGQWLRENF